MATKGSSVLIYMYFKIASLTLTKGIYIFNTWTFSKLFHTSNARFVPLDYISVRWSRNNKKHGQMTYLPAFLFTFHEYFYFLLKCVNISSPILFLVVKRVMKVGRATKNVSGINWIFFSNKLIFSRNRILNNVPS